MAASNQAIVGHPAPDFECEAVVNGAFKQVKLSDYKGKYVVLFAYPLDWTFVCPTEILAFSDRAAEFEKEGCAVLGWSVDSVFSHLAWIQTARKQGGLGGSLNIPLLSDLNKKISEKYGALLLETGHTMRALYIVDGNGILRQITMVPRERVHRERERVHREREREFNRKRERKRVPFESSRECVFVCFPVLWMPGAISHFISLDIYPISLAVERRSGVPQRG
jgi:peroxiredoxin 2/4